MEEYLHITDEELTYKLSNHIKWLNGDLTGDRLYLEGYDLSYRNFNKKTLQGAALIRCYLRGANFNEANCMGINLSHSIITGCSFIETDLYGADLSHLNFSATILKRSDLRTADLSYSSFYHPIDISENKEEGISIVSSNLGILTICSEGDIIGYKKAQGYIVKLKIPENVKRSSGAGRECRCAAAQVISITYPNGTDSGLQSVVSDYDENFIYTIGQTVEVENFDDNRWNTCSNGIHYYITREEALFR